MPDAKKILNLTEDDGLTVHQRLRLWYQALEKKRQPWVTDWKAISEFISYRREFMNLKDTQGKRIGENAFEGWPTIALNYLVNGFQGHLVSPTIKWFIFEFENRRVRELKAAKIWLEDLTRYSYEVFDNTGFYDAIHEDVRDCASIGTSTMYTAEDLAKNRPLFRVMHPIEIVIGVDENGHVDTVFRKFKLSARSAVDWWGIDKLSETLQNAARNVSSMNDEFEFLHAVFPNHYRVGQRSDYSSKPYYSIYIEFAGGNAGEEKVLQEGGYDELPYHVWRWEKNSTEWYGRSPGHNALVDLYKINQLGKDLLGAAHKAVDPPVMAPAGHRGRIRLRAGGVNYYENLANEEIRPILQGINYPVGLDREQDARRVIDKHFMVDFFILLAQSEHKQRTAYEISEMQGEKAVILGPILGKFEQELMNPLIERVLSIEARAGRLPPMPPILHDMGGVRLKVDYIGPLAQIVQRVFRTRGPLFSVANLTPVFQLYPQGVDKIDFDFLIEEVAEAGGMPQRAIRSEEEVAKLRAAKQKIMQQAQQQQMQLEAAKAVDVNKSPEPGSVMEQLMGGGRQR
jgi:hypothetical protein